MAWETYPTDAVPYRQTISRYTARTFPSLVDGWDDLPNMGVTMAHDFIRAARGQGMDGFTYEITATLRIVDFPGTLSEEVYVGNLAVSGQLDSVAQNSLVNPRSRFSNVQEGQVSAEWRDDLGRLGGTIYYAEIFKFRFDGSLPGGPAIGIPPEKGRLVGLNVGVFSAAAGDFNGTFDFLDQGIPYYFTPGRVGFGADSVTAGSVEVTPI